MNNPAPLITDEELAADLAALAVESMEQQKQRDTQCAGTKPAEDWR